MRARLATSVSRVEVYICMSMYATVWVTATRARLATSVDSVYTYFHRWYCHSYEGKACHFCE